MIPKAWIKGKKMPSEDLGNNKTNVIITFIIAICTTFFLTNFITCVGEYEKNRTKVDEKKEEAYSACLLAGNSPERCMFGKEGNK